MTFYNIIFGILFLGSFREVIYYVGGAPDLRLFYLAATLSVLIFSDTIFTSLVIEGKGDEYSLRMKLIDLTNFILLSFAVVILNPVSNDMFEVNAKTRLDWLVATTGVSAEAMFWWILATYMVLLVLWNRQLGVHRVMWCYRWLHVVQPTYAVMFAVMAIVTADASASATWLQVARPAVLGLVVLYLLVYKRYISAKLDARVILKPLTDHDVAAIYTWPQYDGRVAELNYAIRKDGWLDEFPETAGNKRYGAWQNGELVGFSLLTGIKDGDAEFFIALHAERRRQQLGREVTLQTIGRGFTELGLRRIHLKVRDWYTGAETMYTLCGFRPLGLVTHKVRGQDVRFIEMEVRRPASLFERVRGWAVTARRALSAGKASATPSP